MAKKTATVASSKHLVRTAGAHYLAVAILAGFAIGFAPPKVYVVGDADAAAPNIADHEGLFRPGLLTDLTHLPSCSWPLRPCLLFHHVIRNAARAIVVFASVSVAI